MGPVWHVNGWYETHINRGQAARLYPRPTISKILESTSFAAFSFMVSLTHCSCDYTVIWS